MKKHIVSDIVCAGLYCEWRGNVDFESKLLKGATKKKTLLRVRDEVTKNKFINLWQKEAEWKKSGVDVQECTKEAGTEEEATRGGRKKVTSACTYGVCATS